MFAIRKPEPRSVTPRLVGGLGNQLFQVAAAQAFARRTGRILRLPRRIREGGRRRTYHEDVFTELPVQSRFELIERRRVLRESGFSYCELTDCDATDVELSGYFQSARYFDPQDVQHVLRPHRTHALRASQCIAALKTRAEGRPLVAMHVRRGDYRYKSDYHPILPSSYYGDALASFREPVLVALFSDDLSVVSSQAPFGDGAVAPVDESDVVSLLVMAACDHHVIANSSFSWWGAYLASERGGRVIAPGRWFGPLGPSDTADLLPGHWETLPCP